MEFSQLLEDFLPSSGGLLAVRAIAASILVFLLPGFAWTLIFFKELSVPERIVFSAGLSIAFVTFGVLVLNILFNVRINGMNTVLTIIVITVIPLAIYFARGYRAKRAGAIDED